MIDPRTLHFSGDRSRLCGNCLERGADTVPVGDTFGPQRDPEQFRVQMCKDCRDALLDGDFARLASRFTLTRTVEQEDAP